MDICNNDDCEISVNGVFDLALELTKIWGKTQKVSATYYDVWKVYKSLKEEIEEEYRNDVENQNSHQERDWPNYNGDYPNS